MGGVFAVGLAQRACWPVIVRARARLPDRAAREALTLYLDAASLVLAALVALLHPLGYVALALFGGCCSPIGGAPGASTPACASLGR